MGNGSLGTIVRHVRTLAAAQGGEGGSDAELLEAFLSRQDQAAFTALMQRHGAMVLGVCRRLLGQQQDAEDAFQATFLILARKAASVRKRRSLSTWLYGAASRMALSMKRAAARRRVHERRARPQPPSTPSAELAWREVQTVLEEEIQRLPEKYRAVFVLCCLESKPRAEAARLLALKEGTVSSRLDHARKHLQARLARRGITLSGVLAATAVSQEAGNAGLPAGLVATTLRAAAALSLRTTIPEGVVSANVATLVEGGLKATFTARRLAIGLLLLLGISAAAGGLIAHPGSAARAPDENELQRSEHPLSRRDEPNAAEAKPARLDRYGDRLPTNALMRLGTLRFRAPDAVGTVAFSPDARTLAVSSLDGLFLFDAVSGKRIKRLRSPTVSPGPIVFSPDGKRLADRTWVTAGQRPKHVVRIWDLANEGSPREYAADHVIWLGWRSANELLALGTEEGGLRLQELFSGASRRFQYSQNFGLGDKLPCACAPRGQTLAATDDQNIIHIWDTVTGRERCTLHPDNAYPCRLALSADGRRLASINWDQVAGGSKGTQLWDTTAGKALHILTPDQKNLLAAVFSPDGQTVVTAGSNGMRFWDVASGRERSRNQGEGSDTEEMTFSPDSRTLVTAQRHSPALHLWDVATGKRKTEPAAHSCTPYAPAFSPDGRRLATGGGLDGTIHFWDLASGESLFHIHRQGQWVRDIAFSIDGKSLFSTWTDDNLWISQGATGELQHVIKLDDPDRPDTYQSGMYMQLSADGGRLVSFSYYYAKQRGGPSYSDTLVTGWDTSKWKLLFRRRLSGRDQIALSLDACVLARSALPELRPVPVQPPIQLENLVTGEQLLTFPALEGQTWPLAFSPDGRLLALNNHDGKAHDDVRAGASLRLWEVASATELLSLPAEAQYHAAFSPEGRLLAVTAPDQQILVWDLAAGRELQRFKGFDADVYHLAFSLDGRRLISSLADSTLLIWNVEQPANLLPGKLGAKGLARSWADLAGTDAARALRARWLLTASPQEAIALLKEHLRPARAADKQRLRQLLADLDSDRFAVRQQAQKGLEEMAELTAPALHHALHDKPTQELRRRVEALLDRLRQPIRRPETLQALRAVAVLEGIRTSEARDMLRLLATGAAEARLTQEATAALERLRNRRGG